MKKKIFNTKLYIDALKQLKMIGIMSFIILSIEAFLVALGCNISESSMAVPIQNGTATIALEQQKATIYSLLEIHPLVLAAFLLITPLMILFLFGFMNRRNSSDFYHSIPDTRECIYLSYVAAVFTWVVGIIVGSTLVSVISTVFMKNVSLNTTSVLVITFTTIAACVFMMGTFLIAMSLSGTVFTNVVIALMVTFVPRFFMVVCTYAVTCFAPFVPWSVGEGIFNQQYNVVTNIFSGMIAGDALDGINSVASGVYTIIVGIVYIVIGMIIFKKRNSEAATCAAINSKLQCVFRLIPAFIICIVPCMQILDVLVDKSYSGLSDAETIFMIAAFYVVAVIAYFLYELITTKKWKNIAKAVPGLGILVVLNLIFVGGMYASIKFVANDIPQADEIEYVKLYSENKYQSYFADKIKDIELDSDIVKNITSEQLQQTVSSWEDGSRYSNNYRGYYGEFRLAIKTGSGTIYRDVTFDEQSYKAFMDQLYENDEFLNAYRDLPEIGKNQTKVTMRDGSEEFSDANVRKLYEKYIEEVRKMDFVDYFEMLSNSNGYAYNSIGYMQIETTIGTKSYSISLPIISEAPETMQLYISLANSVNNSNPITEFLSHDSDKEIIDGYANYNISFQVYDIDEHYYASAYIYNGDNYINKDYTSNGKTLLEKIAKSLDESDKDISLTDIKEKKLLLEVDYGEYEYMNTSVSKNYTKWYVIDEDVLGLINQYSGRGNK